jgi:hypothetical protein
MMIALYSGRLNGSEDRLYGLRRARARESRYWVSLRPLRVEERINWPASKLGNGRLSSIWSKKAAML